MVLRGCGESCARAFRPVTRPHRTLFRYHYGWGRCAIHLLAGGLFRAVVVAAHRKKHPSTGTCRWCRPHCQVLYAAVGVAGARGRASKAASNISPTFLEMEL